MKGQLLKDVIIEGKYERSLLYVADEIIKDGKVMYMCISQKWGNFELEEVKVITKYAVYKNSALKKAFKEYYKSALKLKEIKNKECELREELSKNNSLINNLLEDDKPTIKGLVSKLDKRNNCCISSYSCAAEGSITISKENDLDRRPDLVMHYNNGENELNCSEESFYKKYCPAKKDKAFFKGLKFLKIKKIENGYETGEKCTVSAYVNYYFDTKVTKKNKEAVLKEMQWVIDNV